MHKENQMRYVLSRNTAHVRRARAVLAMTFCAALVMPAIFAVAAPPATTVDIKSPGSSDRRR
jgi:hypothetical protein